MNPDDIKHLIEAGLECSYVNVDGDGRHFEAVVVSSKFESRTTLSRHRLVYATLDEHFASEALHALSLKTYTPEQWREQKSSLD